MGTACFVLVNSDAGTGEACERRTRGECEHT